MKLKLALVLLALSALVACGEPTATPAAVAPTTAPAAATEAATAAATAAATTAATEVATAAATDVPTAAATDVPTAAATTVPAATDAPTAAATTAPADTANATQVTQKLVLTIDQIDDDLVVKVNGTEVITHGLIRMNGQKIEQDLAANLKPGSNTVEVIAKNRLAAGVLIGNLAADGNIIKTWKISDYTKPNANFVDDSFAINYTGGSGSAATAGATETPAAATESLDILIEFKTSGLMIKNTSSEAIQIPLGDANAFKFPNGASVVPPAGTYWHINVNTATGGLKLDGTHGPITMPAGSSVGFYVDKVGANSPPSAASAITSMDISMQFKASKLTIKNSASEAVEIPLGGANAFEFPNGGSVVPPTGAYWHIDMNTAAGGVTLGGTYGPVDMPAGSSAEFTVDKLGN